METENRNFESKKVLTKKFLNKFDTQKSILPNFSDFFFNLNG